MSDRPSRGFDRMTIVGAAGAVGTLLARQFRSRVRVLHGLDLLEPRNVDSFDAFFTCDARDPAGAARRALTDSDCVVIATPAEAAVAIAVPIASLLPEGRLLVDTLSVKMRITSQLEAAGARCEYLSINPMFAPSLGFDGQNVLVVGHGQRRLATAFARALESWGARVWPMSAEEHDRFCAVAQAATHFLILSLGKLLGGTTVPATIEASPPPHRICLALLARMLAGSPEVYWEIQRDNAFAPDVRRALLAGARELQELIERQPRDAFVQNLASVRTALGAHFEPMVALGDTLVRAAGAKTEGEVLLS